MSHCTTGNALCLAIFLVLMLLVMCQLRTASCSRFDGGKSEGFDRGPLPLNPPTISGGPGRESNCYYGPFDEENVFCSHNWGG